MLFLNFFALTFTFTLTFTSSGPRGAFAPKNILGEKLLVQDNHEKEDKFQPFVKEELVDLLCMLESWERAELKLQGV